MQSGKRQVHQGPVVAELEDGHRHPGVDKKVEAGCLLLCFLPSLRFDLENHVFVRRKVQVEVRREVQMDFRREVQVEDTEHHLVHLGGRMDYPHMHNFDAWTCC